MSRSCASGFTLPTQTFDILLDLWNVVRRGGEGHKARGFDSELLPAPPFQLSGSSALPTS
jgi:hypothetical protein